MKKNFEIQRRLLRVKTETVRKLSESQLQEVAAGGSTGNSDAAPKQTICLACQF
jgi:hypothetical protein